MRPALEKHAALQNRQEIPQQSIIMFHYLSIYHNAGTDVVLGHLTN